LLHRSPQAPVGNGPFETGPPPDQFSQTSHKQHNSSVSNKEVSCMLSQRIGDGNSVMVSDETHTTSGIGTFTLTYGKGTAVAGSAKGYEYFRCVLPAGVPTGNSGVMSYGVTEGN
jgi:hypothetical protein